MTPYPIPMCQAEFGWGRVRYGGRQYQAGSDSPAALKP
jgi:hypothetical protein